MGADVAEQLLAKALELPEKRWKKTKLRFAVSKGDTTIDVLDSAAYGKNPACELLSFVLEGGDYGIETCSVEEAEVMLFAARLTRV